MHLSMSSRQGVGGGGGGAYGRDLTDHFGPGVLAVLGGGIFAFLFVPGTKNHFPGWGISVIFVLTFLPDGK